jgi:predicted acyltransferase (DUF342 family)
MMRMLSVSRFGPALLAVVLGVAGGPARAQVGGYAVFGTQGVSIGQSGTINGVVASNGDVAVNPFSTFNGLTGGGSLLGNTLGDFTVNGPVTFNGNVTTGQFAKINGPINSGGNVDLRFSDTATQSITARGDVFQGQAAATTGNIMAGGSFSNGDFSVVNGNVFANANVTVNGSVKGNVEFGNSLTIGPFGSITGTQTHGTVAVNPASYAIASIPHADSFSSGGPPVTGGTSLANPLAPGSYGALNIPTFGNLYLTAGNYFFDSFSFNGDAIHLLNLTPQSRINIFVKGDVFENTFSNVFIGEQPFGSANASLASNVLLETLGNYSQNSLGSVKFFGTIFAPDGNITIGQFSSLTGSLIAGGRVDIGVGFNETFVSSSTLFVPEPSSAVLLVVGLAGVLVLARKRRRGGSRSEGGRGPRGTEAFNVPGGGNPE